MAEADVCRNLGRILLVARVDAALSTHISFSHIKWNAFDRSSAENSKPGLSLRRPTWTWNRSLGSDAVMMELE